MATPRKKAKTEAAGSIVFPKKLRFLFRPARFKVPYGGRGSAKSWSVAKALLILGAQKKLRILCAREFQNSIRESVHKLLSTQIEAMGLQAFYSIQDRTIVGQNGTEFIFEGLRRNTLKIKSMEGIDIVWVEEAQAVSKGSWEVLIPTIRAPGSEIWVTFNPDSAEDDTYQRFVIDPPPGAVVVLVNWSDNPWFPAELRSEMEFARSRDLDTYENVWLGQPKRKVRGALWSMDALNLLREAPIVGTDARDAFLERMQRVVVAVDPSGCSGKEDTRSDEVGIVVTGLGRDGHGYLLADHTGRHSPDAWGKLAVTLSSQWKADRIVAESNFGGALVESTIRSQSANASVKLVRASRGKVVRAEPVAALYEQSKVHHVGSYPDLERQLCGFSAAGYQGKRSPDRADALVWGITELMLDDESTYDDSMAWVG